ncbi:four helix bundle protein [Symmachiella dynata]|nr:four helix bundle protein [Symmachiella dynata]
MTAVRHYRDLVAWQKAMDIVEAVYRATSTFPADERFGLTQQLRRAVVSVPSNIAERQGRKSTNEFIHFLSIAKGSLCEVETQLIIAQRLGYLQNELLDQLLTQSDEVGRIMNGLTRSLAKKTKPQIL